MNLFNDDDWWAGKGLTTSNSTSKPATVAEMMKAIRDAERLVAKHRAINTLDEALADSPCYTPNIRLPLTGRPLQASIPVYPDKLMTKTRPAPTRRRRRLWRHWLATCVIPDPNLYVVAGQMVIGHPDTIARMAEALNRLENQIPAPDQMEWKTTS